MWVMLASSLSCGDKKCSDSLTREFKRRNNERGNRKSEGNRKRTNADKGKGPRSESLKYPRVMKCIQMRTQKAEGTCFISLGNFLVRTIHHVFLVALKHFVL